MKGIDPEYVSQLEQLVISLQMGLDAYQEIVGVVAQYMEGFKIWDKSTGEVFHIDDNPIKLTGNLENLEILLDNVIPYDFK